MKKLLTALACFIGSGISIGIAILSLDKTPTIGIIFLITGLGLLFLAASVMDKAERGRER